MEVSSQDTRFCMYVPYNKCILHIRDNVIVFCYYVIVAQCKYYVLSIYCDTAIIIIYCIIKPNTPQFLYARYINGYICHDELTRCYRIINQGDI